MFASINDCRTLARCAAEVGATELPASLARPLQTYDALQEARRSWGGNGTQSALTALMTGKAVPTAKRLNEVIDAAAMQYARAQVAREVSESAEGIVAQQFRTALAGDGGDKLAELLRPRFADAADDLAAGMALVSPGMTAQAAIDAGPETVAAWSGAPAVLARLNAFAVLANLLWREFALVGDTTQFDHFHSRFLALFLDPEAEPDLTGAAVAYTTGATSLSEYRFGGWQSMLIGTGHRLRLNSPREADQLCHRHTEANAERYPITEAV